MVPIQITKSVTRSSLRIFEQPLYQWKKICVADANLLCNIYIGFYARSRLAKYGLCRLVIYCVLYSALLFCTAYGHLFLVRFCHSSEGSLVLFVNIMVYTVSVHTHSWLHIFRTVTFPVYWWGIFYTLLYICGAQSHYLTNLFALNPI